MFGVIFRYQNFKQLVEMCNDRSTMIKQLCVPAVLSMMVSIWKQRNARMFYEESLSVQRCMHEVRGIVLWTVKLMKMGDHCIGEDEITLDRMGLHN